MAAAAPNDCKVLADGFSNLGLKVSNSTPAICCTYNITESNPRPPGGSRILCHNGRIIAINLQGTSLNTGIPFNIGRLDALTDLNLAFTGLSGSLPSELGSLRNLQYFQPMRTEAECDGFYSQLSQSLPRTSSVISIATSSSFFSGFTTWATSAANTDYAPAYSTSKSADFPVAALAGGVGGAVLLLTTTILVFFFLRKRRAARRHGSPDKSLDSEGSLDTPFSSQSSELSPDFSGASSVPTTEKPAVALFTGLNDSPHYTRRSSLKSEDLPSTPSTNGKSMIALFFDPNDPRSSNSQTRSRAEQRPPSMFDEPLTLPTFYAITTSLEVNSPRFDMESKALVALGSEATVEPQRTSHRQETGAGSDITVSRDAKETLTLPTFYAITTSLEINSARSDKESKALVVLGSEETVDPRRTGNSLQIGSGGDITVSRDARIAALSPGELAEKLSRIGLGPNLVSILQENAIAGADFLALTDADLIRMGIQEWYARDLVMRTIAYMQASEAEPQEQIVPLSRIGEDPPTYLK
ncbi:hypothetical protein HDU96_006964 [Phlyctochytrium bullatum]|nr:hypothetical protein HDU96_006964 [Phlyctochytrium bullatum]